jgi:hypothetical protein
MNWLSNHFWLLFGCVGGAVFVFVVFLLQRLFGDPTDDDAIRAAVQDSQSPKAPGVGDFPVTPHRQRSKKRA